MKFSAELERVARTEIASKENLGMYMSEQELDVEYHQWKTARDERVRDSHVDMEGEITRVGSPFSNGMMYPGDFSSGADLGELINCRCTVMPFVMPEGYMAPAGMSYFRESDLVPIKKPEDKPVSQTETRVEPSFADDREREKYIRDIFERSGQSIREDEAKKIKEGIEEYTSGGMDYKTLRKYSELGEDGFEKYLKSTMGSASEERIASEVAHAKMRVEAIEKFLKVAPKAPQKDIFRGIQLYEYEVEKLLQKGKTFTDSAFSSFSNIKDVAKNRGNVILQTVNNKGVSISGFSRYADEAEVLMPKNIEFLIKNIKRVGRGENQKIYVTLEEIAK